MSESCALLVVLFVVELSFQLLLSCCFNMKFNMPLKILLADKDYQFYLSLRKQLAGLSASGKDTPCELIWCGERKEMIRAAQADVYDLVLFDYDDCGGRLLQRTERAGVRTPIVALTDGSQYSETKARRDGAFGCIAKPSWDLSMLKHYLLCADLYRTGELHQADERLVAQSATLSTTSTSSPSLSLVGGSAVTQQSLTH